MCLRSELGSIYIGKKWEWMSEKCEEEMGWGEGGLGDVSVWVRIWGEFKWGETLWSKCKLCDLRWAKWDSDYARNMGWMYVSGVCRMAYGILMRL